MSLLPEKTTAQEGATEKVDSSSEKKPAGKIPTGKAPAEKTLRIMLSGNPNSGKTTVFNGLTGLSYKVGNYPGVTVERKEGRLRLGDGLKCAITDLPGTYSLAGESLDEKVAQMALSEKPDLLIAVVDSTNLERNLFLISELIDLKVPLILALNMSDIADKRGIRIRTILLSQALDIPVVRLSASKNKGIEELKHQISASLNSPKVSSKTFAWAEGDTHLIEQSLNTVDQAIVSYGEIASARYLWINKIIKSSVSIEASNLKDWSKKIDKIATHRVYGLVTFFIVMAVMFQSIFSWASMPMEFIDTQISNLGQFINANVAPGQLRSLLVDGVLAGVGSVLVFIPQIALLFFFIGILEDSGYLCRAAYVMDRVMRKVGMQGRSFIPLLSSFACAVPGIMSTRSIPSIGDRLVTILVAPLMSCSARLPVYAVLIAAFIPKKTVFGFFSLQGVTMFSVYFLGIAGAAVVARALKWVWFKGEPALFVMEMPVFRMPSFVKVVREVWDRILIFLKSAGTIILACSVILWFLASHPMTKEGEAPAVKESYAGQIGTSIEPLIKPLGYNWEIGIALFTSFAAREVFVSTLATVYSLDSSDDSAKSLTKQLADRDKSGSGFGLATALSLLVFYVFACQCMSTLAVTRRETGSWKWPTVMFLYMSALAYGAAFIVYRLSLWFLN